MPRPPTTLFRAVRAGIAFTVAGAPLLYALDRIFEGHSTYRLIVAPTLVCLFVIGTLAWNLIVLAPDAPPRPTLRGATAGIVTGLLPHPLVWTFAFVWGSDGRSLRDVVAGIIFYLLWGLVVAGLPSVVYGAIVGSLLARGAFFRAPLTRSGP